VVVGLETTPRETEIVTDAAKFCIALLSVEDHGCLPRRCVVGWFPARLMSSIKLGHYGSLKHDLETPMKKVRGHGRVVIAVERVATRDVILNPVHEVLARASYAPSASHATPNRRGESDSDIPSTNSYS
jgi:hypothetical protein